MRRVLTASALVVVVAVALWLASRGCKGPAPLPVPPPVPVETPALPIAPPPPVAPGPVAPAKPAKPKVETPAAMQPPPVQLHTELIPKNIEIVRVYYPEMITAPGRSIRFDINGTGFTREFGDMIKAESGKEHVAVKDLELVTPNQIRGTLVVGPKATTSVAFPRVLIKGKVVFQAREPFAVIRPGEVLNVIFTDMGETGRTGRFRVYTNLTPEQFTQFTVSASTRDIAVTELTPAHPFIVDGTINIGPAVGGDYGLVVRLKEKVIWERKGIIRVVKPNIGQSGLAQRIQALDGYHRPGDVAGFAVQGSGFQPQDASLLQARVTGWDSIVSSFVFVAPGRMDLNVAVPKNASPGAYTLSIIQGEQTLLALANAFEVVKPNWTRGLIVQPPLVPGGSSTVELHGRDLSPDFVKSLAVEVDEAALSVGSFSWANASVAQAPVAAGPKVAPGDYLLKITSGGKPVNPENGSIIRVLPASP